MKISASLTRIFQFAFFFVITTNFSQNNTKVLDPNLLIVQGDSLLGTWKLEEARVNYEKAKSIFEEQEDWENLARSINKLASYCMKARKYDLGLENTKTALKVLETHNIRNSFQEYKAYFNIGFYHDFADFNFDKSLEYYRKALEFERQVKVPDSSFLATVNNGMGVLYSKQGFYKEAIPFYKKTLEISRRMDGEDSPEVAQAYGNMGLNYHAMGDYEKSIEFQKKAIDIDIKVNGEMSPNVAIAYTNISETYEGLLDLGKAIYYGEKALAIGLARLGEGHSFVGGIYQRLSSLYIKIDEAQKALDYGKRSLEITKRVSGEDNIELIFPLSTLASVSEYMGNINEAIKYGEEALRISLKHYGDNHLRSAIGYSFVADFITKDGQVDRALEYHQKSIDIFKKFFSDDNNHPRMSRTYQAMALNYQKKGQNTKALESYFEALEITKKIRPKNPVQLASINNKMGAFFLEIGKEEKASAYLDNALQILNEGADDQSSLSQNDFVEQQLLIKIYKNQCALLERNLKGNIRNLENEKIRQLHRKVDSIIDNIRFNTHYQEDKILFSENVKDFYDMASDFYLQRPDLKDVDLNQAFYFVEKSRFRFLKELLTQRKAIEFSDVPKRITEVEDSLKLKQAYYRSKLISGSPTVNAIKDYERELFLTNRSYDSLLVVIKEKYPEYFGYKYQTPVVNLNELRESLSKNELILEYALVEEKLYLFFISNKTQDVYQLKAEGLSGKIKEFNDAIAAKNTSDFKKISNVLFRDLLSEALKNTKADKLTIIPDGPLWQLNFDLLLTKTAQTNNPKKLPLLLKEYAIGYENSASSFLSNHVNRDNQVDECLAFSYLGDTEGETGNVLRLSTIRNSENDLPGTREEIKAISNLLNGDYYYGNLAVESKFKENAHKYSVLHLALHGEIDDENPEDSRLFFTKGKDSIEDGFLYAHEIFALNLPSKMTVLSACNTGMGKLTSGEGLIGLGSAFQYAGTKSLILSKWEVSDASAPVIMDFFYQNLKAGMTKSKALQNAKLTYLESASGEKVHPFYWGSFYVLGDNGALVFEEQNYYAYLLLLIPIFILIYSLLKRFPRTSRNS